MPLNLPELALQFFIHVGQSSIKPSPGTSSLRLYCFLEDSRPRGSPEVTARLGSFRSTGVLAHWSLGDYEQTGCAKLRNFCSVHESVHEPSTDAPPPPLQLIPCSAIIPCNGHLMNTLHTLLPQRLILIFFLTICSF